MPGLADGTDVVTSQAGAAWAHDLVRELLQDLPNRLAHSVGVGRRSEELSHLVPSKKRPVLVAAGYLHDIGYSRRIESTGFHALDGAVYLSNRGWHEIGCLVAHHSASKYEARVRKLEHELDPFEEPAQELLDALTYCDLTVGHDGRDVSVDERLSEVKERYRATDPIAEAVNESESSLRASVARVRSRMEHLS